MIQASELLLQERMPRNVAVAHPRAEEVNTSAAVAGAAPVTHLLSNGRYAVMLTATGAGYSALARHGGDALARRRNPRRLGLLHLPAIRRAPSSAKALLCNGVGRVVMTIFACGLTGVEVML